MSKQKNTFLITGAAGFVGSCLTRRLVEQGVKVNILLKPDSKLWRLSDLKSRLNIFKGDLTDKKFVDDAIGKINPTVIYHLAAHGAYSAQNDAEKIIKTNILGTWNLLNACAKINYKVFVNTGSSSEYGFKSQAMRETDFLEPNSYYAVAKSAQSLLCSYFSRLHKKPICTFRLFSVYGYFEEPTRLVPTLITSCLKGRKLKMVSPKTARDFIFVEDVVDAYLRLGVLGRLKGEILNIGTGRQVTLKEMVDAALKLTQSKITIQWGKMPSRIWDTNIWVADTKHCERVLGWKAKTPLKEGLRKTIEWFGHYQRQYGAVYK